MQRGEVEIKLWVKPGIQSLRSRSRRPTQMRFQSLDYGYLAEDQGIVPDLCRRRTPKSVPGSEENPSRGVPAFSKVHILDTFNESLWSTSFSIARTRRLLRETGFRHLRKKSTVRRTLTQILQEYCQRPFRCSTPRCKGHWQSHVSPCQKYH